MLNFKYPRELSAEPKNARYAMGGVFEGDTGLIDFFETYEEAKNKVDETINKGWNDVWVEDLTELQELYKM